MQSITFDEKLVFRATAFIAEIRDFELRGNSGNGRRDSEYDG